MKNIKKNVSDALELPKEVLLNLPLISLMGKEELLIENYKGIIEYGEEKIRINTGVGVLKIEGKRLLLKHITAENIIINGDIVKFEYLM